MRCIIHQSSKEIQVLKVSRVLRANAISKHWKLFCVLAHLSILTRDDKLTFVWPTKYLAACHRKKIPCRTLWQFDLLNVYPLRDTLVFDIIQENSNSVFLTKTPSPDQTTLPAVQRQDYQIVTICQFSTHLFVACSWGGEPPGGGRGGQPGGAGCQPGINVFGLPTIKLWFANN